MFVSLFLLPTTLFPSVSTCCIGICKGQANFLVQEHFARVVQYAINAVDVPCALGSAYLQFMLFLRLVMASVEHGLGARTFVRFFVIAMLWMVVFTAAKEQPDWTEEQGSRRASMKNCVLHTELGFARFGKLGSHGEQNRPWIWILTLASM